MTNKKLLFQIQLRRKDSVKGLTLPTNLNEDLAYLCGVFTGDGSIYKRASKHAHVITCVGNPKDEKEFYYKVIGPCFRNLFWFLPKIGYQDSRTTFGYTIYSKSLFTFFTQVMRLPSGIKYGSLAIPKVIKGERNLVISFLRRLFDTDGCISFKKKYTKLPYYPVVSLSSKSKNLIKEVSKLLKSFGFALTEMYDYKVKDVTVKELYTIINRIDINGKSNFRKWLHLIGFERPKHKNKINLYWNGKRP